MRKAIPQLSIIPIILFFLPLFSSKISIKLRVYGKDGDEEKTMEYEVHSGMKVSALKDKLLDELISRKLKDLTTRFSACKKKNLYCDLSFFSKKEKILLDLKDSKRLSAYGIKEGSVLELNFFLEEIIKKNPAYILHPVTSPESIRNQKIYPLLNLEKSFDAEIEQQKELKGEVKDDFLKNFIKRILYIVALRQSKGLYDAGKSAQKLILHVIKQYPHLCNQKFTEKGWVENMPLTIASLTLGLPDLLSFLIEQPDIQLEAKNPGGVTILNAAIRGFLMLLLPSCRLDEDTKKKNKKSYLNLIKALLKVNADPNVISIKNPEDAQSVLEYIIKIKHQELIEEILKSKNLKTDIKKKLISARIKRRGNTSTTDDNLSTAGNTSITEDNLSTAGNTSRTEDNLSTAGSLSTTGSLSTIGSKKK